MTRPLGETLGVCLWTFVDPIRVHRLVWVAARKRPVRLAWCLVGGAAGAIVSVACLGVGAIPVHVLFCILGVVFSLVAALDVGEFHAMGMGPLLLAILAVLLALPSRRVDQAANQFLLIVALFAGLGLLFYTG